MAPENITHNSSKVCHDGMLLTCSELTGSRRCKTLSTTLKRQCANGLPEMLTHASLLPLKASHCRVHLTRISSVFILKKTSTRKNQKMMIRKCNYFYLFLCLGLLEQGGCDVCAQLNLQLIGLLLSITSGILTVMAYYYCGQLARLFPTKYTFAIDTNSLKDNYILKFC